MKTRDIVVGLAILVILITGIVLVRRAKNKAENLPLPTPSISERINTAFPGLSVPDGVERAELTDVSGGDAIGVATRTEIVANLPDGQVYKGYLQNSQGKTVLLGTFRVAKGGWILEYNSTKYPGYDKVVVSAGSKHILEGSF